ncbi:MAG: ankyrin repeat domain-containing protein, partial [Frankiaceae bacterium]|nr:ankyrin repeat domain-containing protein [Frankiaceae bacterium]
MQILLARGADTAPDRDGRTPLHHLGRYTPKMAGFNAALTLAEPGEIAQTALALLDARVSALRKDANGQTCYHAAAKTGNAELVQTLVQRGVRVSLTDAEGNTGLHLAADGEGENYLHTVQAFLAGQVDADARNTMGQTARDIAIRAGNKAIAAALSADGDSADGGDQAELHAQAGGMSLHQAVYRCDADAIRALLALGADPNEISDDHDSVGALAGMTPLGLAVRALSLPAMEILLASGAQPDFRNDDGRAAVSYLFTYDTDIHLLRPAFAENA